MLFADRLALRVIGSVIPGSDEAVVRYRAKLQDGRLTGHRWWARLPVSRRDDLGDIHGVMVGLGFVAAVVVNLVGLGLSVWLDGTARIAAVAPVLVVAALIWTFLVFHAVFGQLRFKAHRDDWDFTITVAPPAAVALFAAFAAVEAVVLLG